MSQQLHTGTGKSIQRKWKRKQKQLKHERTSFIKLYQKRIGNVRLLWLFNDNNKKRQ